MAHSLTPTPSPDVLVVPDPGDARTAASVETPFQATANYLAWLKTHTPAANSLAVELPTTGGVNDPLVNATGWIHTSTLWIQADVSSAAAWYLDLNLPGNITLQSLHLHVRGNGAGGSNHSALPVTKPTFTFLKLDPTNENSVVTSFTIADGSASQAVYDAKHNLDLNGINLFIDPAYKYTVKVTGETGTNSAASKLVFHGILADWIPA